MLGSEANCQNLMNIDIDFSDDKDHVFHSFISGEKFIDKQKNY